MAELAISPRDAIEVLPVHFNVPVDYVSVETFVKTAESVNGVITAINDKVFEGALQYELLILPPEAGTFKSRLGVWIRRGGIAVGALWAALESDMGKEFVKGLTGHEPAHYAESAGQSLRQMGGFSGEVAEGELGDAENLERIRCKAEAAIIVETTKAFLEQNQQSLEAVGLQVAKFRDVYQARNEFYQACLADRQVQGIGFDETEDFPIRRSDFAALCVSLPPKEPEPDEEPWLVGIAMLRVTSPNWERDDQTKRQWKGKDNQGRDRLFLIEDEGFWELVKTDSLNLHAVDSIKVQWAFQEKSGKRRNFKVLRVLEYNDQHLSDPLDENALNAILGRYGKGGSGTGGQGSFDF